MSLYKLFKTDKDKESGRGITLKYGTASITIHRAGNGNPLYRKLNNENLRKHGRELELGLLTPEEDNRIMAEIYAESVVIGWENVCDESGKEMAFNKENAVKLFTDLPDLFADLKNAATDRALFKAQELEEDVGKPVTV